MNKIEKVCFEEAERDLKNFMKEEISLEEELLSSMYEGKKAILMNDAKLLKEIMDRREVLFHKMEQAKKNRMEKTKNFSRFLSGELGDEDYSEAKEMGLEGLFKKLGSKSYKLVSLREKIVSLLKKIKEQNDCNNYLLEKKISFNKEFIENLYPMEKNTMYDLHGGYRKGKRKKKAVAIINREV